jgi:hypothetical protein
MMGSAFAQFLDGERRTLGLTHADLGAWRSTRATRKSINVALARATFEEPLPAELMDAHAFDRAMSPKVGPDTGELSADRGELSLDALRDRKLQRLHAYAAWTRASRRLAPREDGRCVRAP